MPELTKTLEQQRHEQLIKALTEIANQLNRLATALETTNLKK